MTWSSSVPRRRAPRWLPAALSPEAARSSTVGRRHPVGAPDRHRPALFWIGGDGRSCPLASTRRSSSSAASTSLRWPSSSSAAPTSREMVTLTSRRPSHHVDPDRPVPQVIALVAMATVIIIMSATSRSRARLGVQGSRGESMFVDLRDRLRAFGELPSCPAAGTPRPRSSRPTDSRSPATSSWRPGRRTAAGSRSCSSTCRARACRPGTRSLLLSGALGGLLGEQEPNRFLTAANNYLLRQNWDEGFATAVHVSIDLATGDYTIGSAGHPPAAFTNSVFRGRWQTYQTNGKTTSVYAAQTSTAAQSANRNTIPVRRAG